MHETIQINNEEGLSELILQWFFFFFKFIGEKTELINSVRIDDDIDRPIFGSNLEHWAF